MSSVYKLRASLGGSVVKNLPANAGDAGSSLGSGKSPGEGNGTPLQYSCLGNPMNGVTERVRHNLMTKQQSVSIVCMNLKM